MQCKSCGLDKALWDFPDDYGLSSVCFDCAKRLLPPREPEQPEEDRGPHGALCPECGTPGGVPIVYGATTIEIHAAAEQGDVVLGGSVGAENARWACLMCGHRWTPVLDIERA